MGDQCLEAEYIDHNLEIFPCTPPWLSHNKSVWCQQLHNTDLSSEQLKSYDIFLTSIVNERKENEECLPPCSFTWYILHCSLYFLCVC